MGKNLTHTAAFDSKCFLSQVDTIHDLAMDIAVNSDTILQMSARCQHRPTSRSSSNNCK